MPLNVSAVVVDSAVASVIFALGVAWAPVVVMVSAVSGVSAAAVLTAVNVPEAKDPALARVFAVLPSLQLLISLLLLFPRFLCSGCCWSLCCSGRPWCCWCINLMIVTPYWYNW